MLKPTAITAPLLCSLLGLAIAADARADDPPEPGPELSVAGVRVHADAEPSLLSRWGGGAHDVDLIGRMWLEVGEPHENRFGFSAMADVITDVDGASKGGPDGLRNLDDTMGPTHARLYHAYAEGRRLGPIDRIRVGRQFTFEAPEWLLFDGAHVRSAQIRAAGRLHAEAYGGIPTQLYDSPQDKGAVAGAAVGAHPWDGARLRADWLFLQGGDPTPNPSSHIYGLRLWQRLTPELMVHGGGTFLDKAPRDLRGSVIVTATELGFTAQAKYYQLLRRRRRIAVPGDYLNSVLFLEQPFWRATMAVEKSWGQKLSLGAGGDFRDLTRNRDDSTLNRSYQRLWFGPSLRNVGVRGLRVTLHGELWRAPKAGSPGDSMALAGEIRYRHAQAWQVAAGSDYMRYRYNRFDGDDREHSRRVFGEVSGEHAPWGLRGRMKYELENTSRATFHTLWLTVGGGL